MKVKLSPDVKTSPGVENASKVSLILFILALCVTSAVHLINASSPYTYRHGFISAVFATSAREFARDGILALGGVPVANNPPIGEIDSYVHWPPFLPITLSIWFDIFGISETAGHSYMLIVQIATALLIFEITRDWLGSAAAALAGFFWLTLPVVVHYSHVIVAESVAVVLMLAAFLAFLRLRPWLAALAAFVAVCTSWEAILLAPGLWAASMGTQEPAHRRITLACTAAIGLALSFNVIAYGIHSPALFKDALHTALFRMGLSHTYSQSPISASVERYVPVGESVSRILWNFPRMLGLFGSSALVLLIISRPKGSNPIVYILGAPWLLWCILMRNHFAVHDIEMQLAAPLAAIALAWMAVGILARGISQAKEWAVLGFVLFAIVVQPWIFGTERSPEDPKQIIGFAAELRRATSPDAVILSSLVSAIPLYYSERHIIRGISNESMMKQLLPYVHSQYPKARLYWATPLESEPWAVVTEVR